MRFKIRILLKLNQVLNPNKMKRKSQSLANAILIKVSINNSTLFHQMMIEMLTLTPIKVKIKAKITIKLIMNHFN